MYQTLIKQLAPEHDPRHIEGYMRLQYSTLDHLSRADFAAEVALCVERPCYGHRSKRNKRSAP